MAVQNVTARTGTTITGNDVDLLSEEYHPPDATWVTHHRHSAWKGMVNTARRLTGASTRTSEREDGQAL